MKQTLKHQMNQPIGLALKYTSFRNLQKEEHHQDELYWEVPNEQKDE